MNIKDEKINELINRAESYRKDLSNNKFNSFENIDLDNIFNDCFKDDLKNEDINNKNNIYLKCKISKEDALHGCTKDIKYKKIGENGKKELSKMNLKVPGNIKNGSNIILRGCGNYIQEIDKMSDLIVKIKIKK